VSYCSRVGVDEFNRRNGMWPSGFSQPLQILWSCHCCYLEVLAQLYVILKSSFLAMVNA